MPPVITCDLLDAPGIRHAFFTRQGGVSTGVYASLNGGVGSRDERAHVLENRARMAATLGVEPASFLVPFQWHSADAIVAETPWDVDHRPRADGIVTRTRGIGLGVTGADCGVVLFSDAAGAVIGAAHSGWKGALTGVLEATIDRMVELGAQRSRIVAVLGPTIGPDSYEVGAEFVERFRVADAAHARFFRPSRREGHSMFDLPGFITMRMEKAGVAAFRNLGLDTYADEERFYSYRRSVHRSEPDYGRLVAGIALA